MYCPVCHCEYIAAVTVCSDCQVALVPELPGEESHEIPAASADDSPWVLLWSGGDPHRQEEICAVLEDEQIPARSSLEGGLLSLAAYSSYDVYVPAPLSSKAKEVLHQFALSEEEWRHSGADAGIELPAEEDVAADGNSAGAADWVPEDATSQIWSGTNARMASMVAASLRENRIPFRADPGVPAQQIFVLPGDEARAKEIVRQIEDAAAL